MDKSHVHRYNFFHFNDIPLASNILSNKSLRARIKWRGATGLSAVCDCGIS